MCAFAPHPTPEGSAWRAVFREEEVADVAEDGFDAAALERRDELGERVSSLGRVFVSDKRLSISKLLIIQQDNIQG